MSQKQPVHWQYRTRLPLGWGPWTNTTEAEKDNILAFKNQEVEVRQLTQAEYNAWFWEPFYALADDLCVKTNRQPTHMYLGRNEWVRIRQRPDAMTKVDLSNPDVPRLLGMRVHLVAEHSHLSVGYCVEGGLS